MIQTLRSVLSPPHPAGMPFIIGGAVVAFVGLFVSAWLLALGVALTLFCLYFFRDPERVAPVRPGAVVAPADGRVVSVLQVPPPVELGLGTGKREYDKRHTLAEREGRREAERALAARNRRNR